MSVIRNPQKVRAALDPKGNQASKSEKFGKVNKEDLKEIGPLGAGGFGYVMLMKHKSTGPCCLLC